MDDTNNTPMLTPTDVLEHIWCPRFTWFMHVQNIPQHEDTRFKVLKGRQIHAQRERENAGYLPKKLGAVQRQSSVYLASTKLRLRGIVDELLWLKDGSIAPLDYKFSKINDKETVYRPHQVQILIYAMLAQEIYQLPVKQGFVAYIRGGSKVLAVPFSVKEADKIQGYVDNIFDIIHNVTLPKCKFSKNRCGDCCYKNICVC